MDAENILLGKRISTRTFLPQDATMFNYTLSQLGKGFSIDKFYKDRQVVSIKWREFHDNTYRYRGKNSKKQKSPFIWV